MTTKQAKPDDSLIEVAKCNANLCRDNEKLRARIKELTPVRICADCKHYAPVIGIAGFPRDSWCMRSPKDVVEGGATQSCSSMRSLQCGEDAKLFEPKSWPNKAVSSLPSTREMNAIAEKYVKDGVESHMQAEHKKPGWAWWK